MTSAVSSKASSPWQMSTEHMIGRRGDKWIGTRLPPLWTSGEAGGEGESEWWSMHPLNLSSPSNLLVLRSPTVLECLPFWDSTPWFRHFKLITSFIWLFFWGPKKLLSRNLCLPCSGKWPLSPTGILSLPSREITSSLENTPSKGLWLWKEFSFEQYCKTFYGIQYPSVLGQHLPGVNKVSKSPATLKGFLAFGGLLNPNQGTCTNCIHINVLQVRVLLGSLSWGIRSMPDHWDKEALQKPEVSELEDFALLSAATCSRWSAVSFGNCNSNSSGTALIKVASLSFTKESKSLLYSSSTFCLWRPKIWENTLSKTVTADSTVYPTSYVEISVSS